MAADSTKQEERKAEPLLIFYDSEAANGNVQYGDVIEIAATCHPGVVVGSFESLVNTKQQLCYFALNKSGIKTEDLKGKPFIVDVVNRFLEWIKEMVELANKKNETKYFPVICAHGGYQFDFLILFANLERNGFPYQKFSNLNIHFADSFLLCKELQDSGNNLLKNTRLSIDGLFQKFFPKHTIKDRHRAMGDVTAMIKIFTQTPLKNLLHLMTISSTMERIDYYVCQASRKTQLTILEEKLSSLDACSKNMSTKKLIREGMTYDVLKNAFQNCSSYMDFWHLLKKIGIERKVAKVLTNQFGALGLQNQGSLGYCLNTAKENGTDVSDGLSSENEVNGMSAASNGLNSEHSNPSSLSNESSEDNISLHNNSTNASNGMPPVNGTHNIKVSSTKNCNKPVSERSISSSQAFEQRPMDYALTSSSDEVRPRVCDATSTLEQQSWNSSGTIHLENQITSNLEKTKTPSQVEFPSSQSSEELQNAESDENWDNEIETTISHRGKFVLQFSEVIPLSVGIDDLTSEPKEKINSKQKKQRLKKEINSRNPEKLHSENQEKKMTFKNSSRASNDNANSFSGKQDNYSEANNKRVKAKEPVSENNGSGLFSSVEDQETIQTQSVNPKESIENKKYKVSNPKRKNRNSKQASSVVFLQSPESPTSPNCELTTFFVGDVEISVPVKKSSLDKDSDVKPCFEKPPSVHVNDSCDINKHDILRNADIQDDNIIEGCKYLEDGINGDQSDKVLSKRNEKVGHLSESREVVVGKVNENIDDQKEYVSDMQEEAALKKEAMAVDEMGNLEKHSSDKEETTITISNGNVDVCIDDETKVELEPKADHTPFEAVAFEADNQGEATVELSRPHGLPGGLYPQMYPIPPMPYRYPAPCPTGMQPNYGFYPSAPPMMPMFQAAGPPPPQLMMYPGMTFSGPQGYNPFGGIQPGYNIQRPMYRPPMYQHCQEQGGPPIHAHEVITQQMNRDSPDILGIPCREGQDNVALTLANKIYDSYSSTSDEYSERCSPHLSYEDSNKTHKLSSESASGASSSTKETPKKNRSEKEQKRERSKIKKQENRKQEKREHKGKNQSSQDQMSKSQEAGQSSDQLDTNVSDTEKALPKLVTTKEPPSEVKVSLSTGRRTTDTDYPSSDSRKARSSVKESNIETTVSTKKSPPRPTTKHSLKGSKVSPKGAGDADYSYSDSRKTRSSVKKSSIDTPSSSKTSPPRTTAKHSSKDIKVSPKATGDAEYSSSDSRKTRSSLKEPNIDTPSSSKTSPPRPTAKHSSKDIKVSPKETGDAEYSSGDSRKAGSSVKVPNIDDPVSSKASPPRLTKHSSKDIKVSPKLTSRATETGDYPSSDSSKTSSSLRKSSVDRPASSKTSPPRPTTKHLSKDTKASPKFADRENRDAQDRSPNAKQPKTFLKGSEYARVSRSSSPRPTTGQPLENVSPKSTRDSRDVKSLKKAEISFTESDGTVTKSSPPRPSTQEISKEVKVSPTSTGNDSTAAEQPSLDSSETQKHDRLQTFLGKSHHMVPKTLKTAKVRNPYNQHLNNPKKLLTH